MTAQTAEVAIVGDEDDGPDLSGSRWLSVVPPLIERARPTSDVAVPACVVGAIVTAGAINFAGLFGLAAVEGVAILLSVARLACRRISTR